MGKYIKLLIILFITISLLIKPILGCTIFYILDKNGNVIVGRNFDSEGKGGRIWFIPPEDKDNGMAIIEQLGVDMPYEGINDKGLFIGISAVPNTHTPFSPFKPIRISLEMVKLVLAKAKSVDEALSIFPKYSVVFGVLFGNPIIHYMIVDKDGNSAIVEYVENKMVIIKDPLKSQIMTNHFISRPDIKPDNETSFERYNIVKENLDKTFNIEDVKNLLRRVRQNTTLWSNVYDLNNKTIYITYRDSDTEVFNLHDELSKGKHGYDLESLKDRKSLEYIESKSKVILRPHWGYGYRDGIEVSHQGIRLLIPMDISKRYGFEFTKLGSLLSFGIVLERRFNELFNTSIGVLDYFDSQESKSNSLGFVLNLGWEPDNHIPFKPFLTYRLDIIFRDIRLINSVSTGFSFEF